MFNCTVGELILDEHDESLVIQLVALDAREIEAELSLLRLGHRNFHNDFLFNGLVLVGECDVDLNRSRKYLIVDDFGLWSDLQILFKGDLAGKERHDCRIEVVLGLLNNEVVSGQVLSDLDLV